MPEVEQCKIVTSSDSSGPVWVRFSQDPREPDSAGIRASDLDRAVVADVLADAYADGRLDQEEFAERSDAAAATKLLGELPALISDLIPATATAGTSLARLSPAEITVQAQQHWRTTLNQALLGMLVPSLITVVIWIATGMGYPWPLWVVAGTGINLVRVVLGRNAIIEEHQRKLERKQRKAIEKQLRDTEREGDG